MINKVINQDIDIFTTNLSEDMENGLIKETVFENKLSAEEQFINLLRYDFAFVEQFCLENDFNKRLDLVAQKNIAFSENLSEEIISSPIIQGFLQERAKLYRFWQEELQAEDVLKNFLLKNSEAQNAFLQSKGYNINKEALYDFVQVLNVSFENGIFEITKNIGQNLLNDQNIRKKIFLADGKVNVKFFNAYCLENGLPALMTEQEISENIIAIDNKIRLFLQLLEKTEKESDLQAEFIKAAGNAEEMLVFLEKQAGVLYTMDDLTEINNILQTIVKYKLENDWKRFSRLFQENENFQAEILKNIDSNNACMLIAEKYEVPLFDEIIDILREEVITQIRLQVIKVMDLLEKNESFRDDFTKAEGESFKQKTVLQRYGINVSETFCRHLVINLQKKLLEISEMQIQLLLKDIDGMKVLCDQELAFSEKVKILQDNGYKIADDVLQALTEQITKAGEHDNVQEELLEKVKYLLVNNTYFREELLEQQGDIRAQWQIMRDRGIELEFSVYEKFMEEKLSEKLQITEKFLKVLRNDDELQAKIFAQAGDTDGMWDVVCEYGFEELGEEHFLDVLEGILAEEDTVK